MRQYIRNIIRSLQIADHMTYVTYPLIKENRLLLKVFDEIYNAIKLCIEIILNQEEGENEFRLIPNSFNSFFNNYAKDYGLNNEQIKSLIEIIELNKKHKNSAMEFSRDCNIVILSDNLTTRVLDIWIIKQYLLLAKEFFVNVSKRIGTKV